MSGPVQEIVLYRVNDPAEFEIVREQAQAKVRQLPDSLGWQHLASVSDAAVRADLVGWRDDVSAKAGAEAVGKAAEFSSFRESIAAIDHIGYYCLVDGPVAAPDTGLGIELGRFRLKKGMDAADMKQAHEAMVRGYLALQDGWRGQMLVELGYGAFMDIALADTRERAEQICATWIANPLCNAFLDYVEDAHMEFGSTNVYHSK